MSLAKPFGAKLVDSSSTAHKPTTMGADSESNIAEPNSILLQALALESLELIQGFMACDGVTHDSVGRIVSETV